MKILFTFFLLCCSFFGISQTNDSLKYNSKAIFAPITKNGKKIKTNKQLNSILLSCEKEKETFKKFRRGNIAYLISSLAVGIGGFLILSSDETTRRYAYIPIAAVFVTSIALENLYFKPRLKRTINLYNSNCL